MANLNWPGDYQEQVEKVLGAPFSSDGKIELPFTYSSIEVAKLAIKKLNLMQKQLRAIKKQVGLEMSEIRALYKVEKSNISQSGGLSELFLGRRFAGRHRQSKRDDLAIKQSQNLKPYENVRSAIDNFLIEFDRVKLVIASYILENRE